MDGATALVQLCLNVAVVPGLFPVEQTRLLYCREHFCI